MLSSAEQQTLERGAAAYLARFWPFPCLFLSRFGLGSGSHSGLGVGLGLRPCLDLTIGSPTPGISILSRCQHDYFTLATLVGGFHRVFARRWTVSVAWFWALVN